MPYALNPQIFQLFDALFKKLEKSDNIKSDLEAYIALILEILTYDRENGKASQSEIDEIINAVHDTIQKHIDNKYPDYKEQCSDLLNSLSQSFQTDTPDEDTDKHKLPGRTDPAKPANRSQFEQYINQFGQSSRPMEQSVYSGDQVQDIISGSVPIILCCGTCERRTDHNDTKAYIYGSNVSHLFEVVQGKENIDKVIVNGPGHDRDIEGDTDKDKYINQKELNSYYVPYRYGYNWSEGQYRQHSYPNLKAQMLGDGVEERANHLLALIKGEPKRNRDDIVPHDDAADVDEVQANRIKQHGRVNIVAWSRGGDIAWRLVRKMAEDDDEQVRNIKVNIITLDTVPGLLNASEDIIDVSDLNNINKSYDFYSVHERSIGFSPVAHYYNDSTPHFRVPMPGNHANLAGTQTSNEGHRVQKDNGEYYELTDVARITRFLTEFLVEHHGTKLDPDQKCQLSLRQISTMYRRAWNEEYEGYKKASTSYTQQQLFGIHRKLYYLGSSYWKPNKIYLDDILNKDKNGKLIDPLCFVIDQAIDWFDHELRDDEGNEPKETQNTDEAKTPRQRVLDIVADWSYDPPILDRSVFADRLWRAIDDKIITKHQLPDNSWYIRSFIEGTAEILQKACGIEMSQQAIHQMIRGIDELESSDFISELTDKCYEQWVKPKIEYNAKTVEKLYNSVCQEQTLDAKQQALQRMKAYLGQLQGDVSIDTIKGFLSEELVSLVKQQSNMSWHQFCQTLCKSFEHNLELAETIEDCRQKAKDESKLDDKEAALAQVNDLFSRCDELTEKQVLTTLGLADRQSINHDLQQRINQQRLIKTSSDQLQDLVSRGINYPQEIVNLFNINVDGLRIDEIKDQLSPQLDHFMDLSDVNNWRELCDNLEYTVNKYNNLGSSINDKIQQFDSADFQGKKRLLQAVEFHYEDGPQDSDKIGWAIFDYHGVADKDQILSDLQLRLASHAKANELNELVDQLTGNATNEAFKKLIDFEAGHKLANSTIEEIKPLLSEKITELFDVSTVTNWAELVENLKGNLEAIDNKAKEINDAYDRCSRTLGLEHKRQELANIQSLYSQAESASELGHAVLLMRNVQEQSNLLSECQNQIDSLNKAHQLNGLIDRLVTDQSESALNELLAFQVSDKLSDRRIDDIKQVLSTKLSEFVELSDVTTWSQLISRLDNRLLANKNTIGQIKQSLSEFDQAQELAAKKQNLHHLTLLYNHVLGAELNTEIGQAVSAVHGFEDTNSIWSDWINPLQKTLRSHENTTEQIKRYIKEAKASAGLGEKQQKRQHIKDLYNKFGPSIKDQVGIAVFKADDLDNQIDELEQIIAQEEQIASIASNDARQIKSIIDHNLINGVKELDVERLRQQISTYKVDYRQESTYIKAFIDAIKPDEGDSASYRHAYDKLVIDNNITACELVDSLVEELELAKAFETYKQKPAVATTRPQPRPHTTQQTNRHEQNSSSHGHNRHHDQSHGCGLSAIVKAIGNFFRQIGDFFLQIGSHFSKIGHCFNRDDNGDQSRLSQNSIFNQSNVVNSHQNRI